MFILFDVVVLLMQLERKERILSVIKRSAPKYQLQHY